MLKTSSVSGPIHEIVALILTSITFLLTGSGSEMALSDEGNVSEIENITGSNLLFKVQFHSEWHVPQQTIYFKV